MATLLCGNKYLMYYIQWLANNTVYCSLCVSHWGSFICRLHLQPCITFHKVNLSSYILITVSSHLYINPPHVTSWCMSFLFISDVHANTCFLIGGIIFLIQASSHKLYVVPVTSSWLSSVPESSQVHRLSPHHCTVWTETAASQHASCSCSCIGKWAVVSVNHFALVES